MFTDKECPADTDKTGTDWFPGKIGYMEKSVCTFGTNGWITRYCDMNSDNREPQTSHRNRGKYGTADGRRCRNNTLDSPLGLGQNNIEPQRYTHSFLDVANTLFDEKIESTWNVLVNQTRTGADSIVNLVDRFLSNMVKQSNGPIHNHTFIKSNLFVAISKTPDCSIVNFPSDTFVDYRKDNRDDSWAIDRSNNIRVPCMKDQVYSGVVYRNISRVVSLNSASDRKWLKTVNAPVFVRLFIKDNCFNTR
ncbi:hypothetical protein DPMN_077402 [Dreissena polymorpha]|uniref:Uncharacterized protein n=1 Tax=Dreissena polymorpha TaxID=45954 RepID=A0A9D3YP82_DREPO|nr:hypothetical protein DPMN_077402 [Dreissena polymorpha]